MKQFTRLGFDIDAVEIDKRVWDVSVEYFNVDPNINIVIDDARHYIKTCGKKYDIVVFDTFLSESVPEHLLTLEGFEDTRKILNPEGMVMINFYGFIKGETGRAARAVLKTLNESEFITEVMATPGTEDTRNLIFIASDKEQDFTLIDYEEPNSKSGETLAAAPLDDPATPSSFSWQIWVARIPLIILFGWMAVSLLFLFRLIIGLLSTSWILRNLVTTATTRLTTQGGFGTILQHLSYLPALPQQHKSSINEGERKFVTI